LIKCILLLEMSILCAVHLNGYLIIGSAVVGLAVGLTGAGGGALMTPMLILLFNVTPASAISSDLVASVVMRPVGAAVHGRARTINWQVVGCLALGSVPAAFFGAYLLHAIGGDSGSSSAQTTVETILGVALLIGAAAMVLRFLLDRRSTEGPAGYVPDVELRPLPTLFIGIVGGVIVGMTSVGSGSLMVVALLFLYPRIRANQLVGTDLAQAVPLTLAAAIGTLIWGSVNFGVTWSLIIGSVPAVIVGSLLSSRVPDRFIRPVIVFVIYMSGLKYAGLSTTALGWMGAITLVLAVVAWSVLRSRAAATPSRAAELAGMVHASGSAESGAAADPRSIEAGTA
jgi:uncharacterized membrane protein YfcA